MPGDTDKRWLADFRVTPHFRLDELALPEGKAARYRLPGAAYPEEWIEERARPLCEVLEAVRTELALRLGREVGLVILSGYRSPEYNRAIGGAERSQHMEGRAADVHVPGVPAALVHDAALALHEAGRVRLGGLGSYANFTHIDVRPGPLARWRG